MEETEDAVTGSIDYTLGDAWRIHRDDWRLLAKALLFAPFYALFFPISNVLAGNASLGQLPFALLSSFAIVAFVCIPIITAGFVLGAAWHNSGVFRRQNYRIGRQGVHCDSNGLRECEIAWEDAHRIWLQRDTLVVLRCKPTCCRMQIPRRAFSPDDWARVRQLAERVPASALPLSMRSSSSAINAKPS